MDDLLNPQHGAGEQFDDSANGENVRVTRTSSRTRGSRGVRNRGSLGSRGASCEYTRVLQSEIHEQLDHSEIQDLMSKGKVGSMVYSGICNLSQVVFQMFLTPR